MERGFCRERMDVRGMKGRGEGVMASPTDRHNSNKN
jgi:hypothetical protein